MRRTTTLFALASGLLASSAAVASGPALLSAGCNALLPTVCVSQVGDGNVAQANVQGQRNGAGTIAPQTATGIRMLGSQESASDIVMPGLDSGVINQSGNDNVASVDIRGQDNDFHVSQNGDRNIATQAVVGVGNQVAVEQGRGAFDSDNVSAQAQIGSYNVLRTQQFGSGNIAVQAQVPTHEAALVTFAGGAGYLTAETSLLGALMGGADHNRILLEQNGDGNEAYLAQIGSHNEIALRQQGGSGISIMQLGSGHSIGIEQPAGQRGVQIIQY